MHLLRHMSQHNHLHNPPACSCPNTYSTTSPITSTCTTHLQPLALATTLPPMTTEAAAQARGLLLNYHLLGIMGHHKHLLQPKPPPALALTHAPSTSKAPAQARGWPLPSHLLNHLAPHKHLHKPRASSCPITSAGKYHNTTTSTSHLSFHSHSHPHKTATSKAPSQARGLLLPYHLSTQH